MMAPHFMQMGGTLLVAQRGAGARLNGFTLVELLVTIAIISLLSELLLTALSHTTIDTQRAHCLSNLRQTGGALQMWLNENNDWLPPGQNSESGLYMGQHPDYMLDETSPRYQRQLVYYLASYLGYPRPDHQLRTAPVFFCPGFEHQVAGLTNIAGNVCYGVTSTNYFKDDAGRPKLSFNPFGYPPGLASKPAAKPSRLSAISAERSLADVYSLVDLDRVAVEENPRAPVWKLLPASPVHSDVRNYLYFDAHAASQRITRPGTL